MRLLGPAFTITILTSVLMLSISESMFDGAVFGQAVPGAGASPAVPVLIAPVAPGVSGQPQPIPTVGAIPVLAPAPGSQRAAAATPAPTPQVFTCTCSGFGYPVGWTGRVSSSSFILAAQAARGQCIAFKSNTQTGSPFIPPPRSVFSAATQPVPGGLTSSPPGQVGSLAGTAAGSNIGTVTNITGGGQPLLNLENAHIAQSCQNCACD